MVIGSDLDLNGASNYLEYLSGTDVQSALSVPVLTASAVGTNQLRLSSPCVGGRQYLLEKTDSLAPPAWATVTNGLSVGGAQLLNTSQPGSTQSFFRVKLSP